MSAHNFCHKEIVILIVNQKVFSVNKLFQCYCMTHGFIFHVYVNLIARNILWRKSQPLLDQRLPQNTSIMQCKIPTVTQKPLFRVATLPVLWICLVISNIRAAVQNGSQNLLGNRVNCYHPLGIFSLLQLNLPCDWLTLITSAMEWYSLSLGWRFLGTSINPGHC